MDLASEESGQPPEQRPEQQLEEQWNRSIRHVAVCLDRSPFGDRVMPHAVALAKAFGAKLTAIHALEPPSDSPQATPTDPLDWELQRAEARKHLAAVEAGHGSTELDVEHALLEGSPAEEIRNWANSHGVDLTALASHGSSGWTEWTLASTARKLTEAISGSILLVPAWSFQEPLKRKVTYDRILVPLDGSPRAEAALPAALSIARAHGSELLLLHVVPMPEGSCPCPGEAEGEDHDLEQRLVDRNTRAARLYVEGVKRHVENDSIRVRTLVAVDGDVRDEILRHITEDHIDLVVMSGHGRGGRSELPFGSVASFLLEHATSPLLVIREAAPDAVRDRLRSRGRGRLPDLANA